MLEIKDGVLLKYTQEENKKKVVIPDNVETIASDAFAHSNITDVVIPDSVRYIKSNAFGYSDLEVLHMGKNVIEIGENAFEGCWSSLHTVYYDGDVESWIKIKFAGSNANPLSCNCDLYLRGEKLVDLVLPEYVTEVTSWFSHCTSIQSATIGDNATKIIYSPVFQNLHHLTLGKSVTTINEKAFKGCNRLIEIDNRSNIKLDMGSEKDGMLALNAKYIYNSDKGEESRIDRRDDGFVFFRDKEKNYLIDYLGDDSDLVLPESYDGKSYEVYHHALGENNKYCSVTVNVPIIGEWAFYLSKKLTTVTVGKNVTTIEKGAFAFCAELRNVVISNSVQKIGEDVFKNDENIENVTIPKKFAGFLNSGLKKMFGKRYKEIHFTLI